MAEEKFILEDDAWYNQVQRELELGAQENERQNNNEEPVSFSWNVNEMYPLYFTVKTSLGYESISIYVKKEEKEEPSYNRKCKKHDVLGCGECGLKQTKIDHFFIPK